jgi:uncharacterized membrane protein
MPIQSKAEAQRRADQIGCFRAELGLLQEENILVLDDGQQSAVTAYHDDLLARLSSAFDIDADRRAKQLSLGMKIASFLGALGLAASVFFLFYQFWGRFSTGTQVAILIAAPMIGLAGTLAAARREKTGYFSKVLGLVALACFVLNLSMLGQIFNITPSENAFLVWAGFAFLLAYGADARLLLAAGIISLAGFLSAKTGTWSGCYWIHFGERPEHFFPAAAALSLISLIPHPKLSRFAEIYRVFALLFLFIPLLILANWGTISYLDFARETTEALYQAAGFLLSAGAIWIGVKRSWPETVNSGNVFFTIFLYTKFYDWWWDWMPKYLFFLLIGLTAILMLLIFKRFRSALIYKATEKAP